MGPGKAKHLSLSQRRDLLGVYKRNFRDVPLILSGADNPTGCAVYLNSSVIFHDYLVLDGRRIVPSSFSGYAPNSLVQCYINGVRHAGEVAVIISHTQPIAAGRPPLRQHLIGVRWFKRDRAFDTSPWDP